ncbi:SLBB domain-containing protein [Marinomonas communis]|uniref:SLBB domain-containing protein n=1 Tax=Marinomonas communis TaxID=28254 RepID=UPI001D196EB1|nr:SLBB domain-containing protein [Marinomonas communis]MCC4275253.1 SLBB domain-containing protein [Marinomonas communis]
MRLKHLFPTLVLTLAATVQAVTPTAAQINQFQSLPRAQQESLARQYGVDLNAISGSFSATTPTTESQAPVLEPVSPDSDDSSKDSEESKKAISKNTGLSHFGYSVLNSSSKSLTVVDDLPVPLDYEMGPGDSINLQIFGKENQTLTLKINRDGAISLPNIGPVAVSGQTFAQLREQLSSIIKEKIIGVDVAITMGSMRTMQVFIAGEAKQPGAYNVNSLTTITQALIASGGIKQTGSLRNIQLKRKGKVVAEFDVYDLLINGDTSKDVRLSSGDTLFIPVRNNSIAIQGQITRPAIYETKNTLSVERLIELAGGAKPNAFLSSVLVQRVSQEGTQQFLLDLTTNQDRRFALKNGDRVSLLGALNISTDDSRRFIQNNGSQQRLPVASETLMNAVALRGEVFQQGPLTFVPGMRISDVINSIEEDLTPSSDLNYSLLVRQINPNQDIEVYQFSLLNVLSNPNSADNLALQEKDQIFVFDNGLEQSYWLGSFANGKARSAGAEQTRQVLDRETGAIVTKDENTELNIAGTEQTTNATGLRKASREALLKPIIDRLKEQANYDTPAQLVDISGAVKFPGLYPLAQNTDVKSLITAAGGLTQDAYLASAELTHRIQQGDSTRFERRNFNLRSVLDGTYSAPLMAQDNLIIKSQPGWQEGMVIELQGEVVFPGTYTFKRGETLRDVIERAGGFTEFAYPEGAVFSRDRLKRQEAERLKFLNAQLKQEISNLALRRQNTSATDPAQAIAIVDQLDNAEPMGRLVIDLDKALKGDRQANLMLEKGDKLYVPALNPVVSVIGEVQFTSNHTYDSNLTVEDYINAAGGTKRQADTDRIYIVKADGSVELPNNSYWFSRNQDPLEPGDTIIVPIDTDYLDGLSTLSTATQILYQIGVAWSAIKD